jgi:transcriptional regulator with XRE-family HTH domain
MDASAANLVSGMRARRGLSMNAVAALASVPASTISRIESGKIDPTLAMLSRLATAMGFSLAPTIAEDGGDEPFAAALQALEGAGPAERPRLVARLPIIATLAPVARRTGNRRFELAGTLPEALAGLRGEGQNPVLSSLEAFAADAYTVRSFTPVIYVDDPTTVASLPAARATSPQIGMLLPTTANVRAFTRQNPQGAMMTREWALLDALASPGRQADVAQSLLGTLIADPAVAA